MEEAGRDCTNGSFVTVVSIGNEKCEEENITATRDADFVTVLRIGEELDENEDITEEVLVYRLPGERLGFGLKFEGGTRAAEYVKRLFIQSCAPDSPASRVLSSWGNLTEGDEVLVIDSRPVNSMTRMDCVKCLKDSNLIIKLLVRHFKQNQSKGKIGEDLPQVISAEKKKVQPPPPPPVPPRKIPRKLLKSNQNVKINNTDLKKNPDDKNPLPPVRQKHADANNNANKAKISKVRTNSPEFKRKRKHSDGSIDPPDAEFYVDLISQESLHSLSESDDTASTISTVIDRNGSSLPSTPRSVQKHLDISNFPDDEELFNIYSSGPISTEKLEYNPFSTADTEKIKSFEQFEKDVVDVVHDEFRNQAGIIAEYITDASDEQIESRGTADDVKKEDTVEQHDENMNIFNLPRLVDFIPKICNGLDQITMMTLFLENERSEHYDFAIDVSKEPYKRLSFEDDIEIYSKWSVSPQLATIGEVEEESINSESLTEGSTTSIPFPTPVVIVHDADQKDILEKTDLGEHNQAEKIMEPLPSDPRQPPDGHEFPDFEENFQKTTVDPFINNFTLNYSQSLQKKTASLNGKPSFDILPSNPLTLTKLNSMSNTDLGAITENRDSGYCENENIRNQGINPLLHTRSQSLCDISFDKRQNEHWQNLYEQRRKTMSKLKGLVIPDSISENDCSSTINLPEIKSSATVPIETFNSLESSEASNETSQPSSMDSNKFSLISPPWIGTANFPKYSPAFKRKDLQLYSTTSNQEKDNSESKTYKSLIIKKSAATPGSSSGDDSNAAVKSVDSSPTMSENNFECVPSRNKQKQRIRPSRYSMETSFLSDYQKSKEEMNTEDESDNDSAVSSSQSSFISRPTASPSPTRSFEYDNEGFRSANRDYRSSESRHLKPASVEAINRKNILASAKCRSGKDLKVGSPVINRKLEDSLHETEAACDQKITPQIIPEEKQVQKIEDKGDDHKSIEEDLKVRKISPQIVNICEPQARRYSSDAISTLPPKPTTNLLKSKFETMAVSEKPQRPIFTRATSKDSAPVFRDILKPVPPVTLRREERISRFGNVKSLSVTDLRKNFEDIAKSMPVATNLPSVKPTAVLNSRKSEPLLSQASPAESGIDSSKLLEKKPRLQQTKQKSLDMLGTTGKFRKVILTPDVVGGSLGITLAGGTDENKEITVYRIRYGSVAYHEGSLTKGDHIISINGTGTSELSHHEAVELLKAPVESFVINVAMRRDITKDENNLKKRSVSMDCSTNPTPEGSLKTEDTRKKANLEIILQKDGNGLGFSVEGGRDSPQGDVPLLVKKIFQGGVAEKDGRLKVGDQILAINDVDYTNLSRIQAWTMMKKIDTGNVKILIYR